jgi:hypothetical protein
VSFVIRGQVPEDVIVLPEPAAIHALELMCRETDRLRLCSQPVDRVGQRIIQLMRPPHAPHPPPAPAERHHLHLLVVPMHLEAWAATAHSLAV